MLRARSPLADHLEKVVGTDKTVVGDVHWALTRTIRVYAEYAETDKLAAKEQASIGVSDCADAVGAASSIAAGTKEGIPAKIIPRALNRFWRAAEEPIRDAYICQGCRTRRAPEGDTNIAANRGRIVGELHIAQDRETAVHIHATASCRRI